MMMKLLINKELSKGKGSLIIKQHNRRKLKGER